MENEITLVDTYTEAVQEARADYWVKPIHVTDQEQDSWFQAKFYVADKAISGLVHFAERK